MFSMFPSQMDGFFLVDCFKFSEIHQFSEFPETLSGNASTIYPCFESSRIVGRMESALLLSG